MKELPKMIPPPPRLRQRPPIPGPPLSHLCMLMAYPREFHVSHHLHLICVLNYLQLEFWATCSPWSDDPTDSKPTLWASPGPCLMMRSSLLPGPLDDPGVRLFVPQKPCYVKSAASTVVKRRLAQHTPQLTLWFPHLYV